MNRTFLILIPMLALAACGGEHADSHAVGAGGGHVPLEAAAEVPKGPHRGRLLTDGDFAVEMTIFEQGVPPEFHVYPTVGGKPVAPSEVKLTVTLSRLDGEVNRFDFAPEQDFLKGSGVVGEPHSFDVKVEAEHGGRKHAWTYDSYEGRTTIAAEMAKASGIETAVAGGGVVRETLTLYGSIQPNGERVRKVTARFPGVIRGLRKKIGDPVKAGEELGAVESNESLQAYVVTAPIDGVVTARHGNPGEQTGSEPLFVVADFSSVWAELAVFPRDRAKLAVGQRARIVATDGEPAAEGRIVSITPVAAMAGGPQGLVARVVVDNGASSWTPGLFVTGEITVGERPAELLVRNEGLQAFRDFTVVFAQVGDTYEVRMLELGATDGEVTEVLGGLKPGTRYATANSYLIKADIEKSGASHDH